MTLQIHVDQKSVTLIEGITRQAVADQKDLSVLYRWQEQLAMQDMEIDTALRNMDERDTSRINLARKQGYTRIAINWVQMRIGALTGEGDSNVDSVKVKRLGKEIAKLNLSNAEKAKKIKEQNIHIRHLLDKMHAMLDGTENA